MQGALLHTTLGGGQALKNAGEVMPDVGGE